MSNLTAEQWSSQTAKQLRQFELTCDESDLFCVGYLIPQVILVELSKGFEEASKAQWTQWLTEFVSDSMTEDKVAGSDAERIHELIRDVAAV